MYWGSVRFFKHLIVVLVAIIILSLTISIIFLGKRADHYRQEVYTLKQAAAQPADKAPLLHQDEDPIEYQKLFPDLYVTPSDGKWVDSSGTVYITFDDGPSDRTAEILNVLKEKDVKATFFVVGKTGEKEKVLMQRIVNEGHTIGIHTYSHDYKSVYASVEAYLTDFEKMYRLIYENTGVKPDIFRFPGGSINVYNAGVYQQIASELLRRGFTYYDWNAANGDAVKGSTYSTVYTNALVTAGNKNKVIMLMHDSYYRDSTVDALPDVIDQLRAKGYKFDKLTKNVKPIAFDYNDD